MITSSDFVCVIRLLTNRSTFFWQTQTSLLFKLSINLLFEIFVSRTIQQSNILTFRRFVNFNIDQQKSTTLILLRSFIYKQWIANKQEQKHHISFSLLIDQNRFRIWRFCRVNNQLLSHLNSQVNTFTSSLLNYLNFDFFRLASHLSHSFHYYLS